MKRNFAFLSVILLLVIGFSNKGNAQTPGTFTFIYSQAAPSASATKNVLAIWIQDSATGAFIKTKARYWGTSTSDHLPSWKAKSVSNVVDALVGATRTASTSPAAFGSRTIVWNGTNVSNVVVPDGTYNIFVESSYCNPEPSANTHWVITNFYFHKGPNAEHLTPTGPTNFTGISLDWAPTLTPVVTTGTTTNIALTSATCSGNVIADNGSAIIERGVCYDTLVSPDSTKTKVTATGTTGAYTCNLTNLISNKTYHVRAYAKNSYGYAYGVDSTFKTLCVKPTTPVATQNNNTLSSNATTGNQWYNTTSGIISGAINQTYNPTANASYYVVVTLNACSSDPSNTIVYSTVGIDALNNNGVKVYPNPVSNELILENTGMNTNQNFEIYNSIGQVVYKGILLEKTTVQTTSFAPGVYVIKLENGKTLEFKKIIKE